MNRLTEAFDKFNMTEENRIQKVKNIIERAIIEYIINQKEDIYGRAVRLDWPSFERCCKNHKVNRADVLEAFKAEGHIVEFEHTFTSASDNIICRKIKITIAP